VKKIEGDLVLENLKKESFRRELYSKLRMNKIGPCRIPRKMTLDNVYILELLEGIDMPLMFNVVDL
jgi:hypothetical protein